MLASRIPGRILHLVSLLLLLPVRASLSMEAWVKSLLPNLAKVPVLLYLENEVSMGGGGEPESKHLGNILLFFSSVFWISLYAVVWSD